MAVDYGIVTASKFEAPSSLSEGLKLVRNASDFGQAFAYEISKHKCYDRELAGLSSQVAS